MIEFAIVLLGILFSGLLLLIMAGFDKVIELLEEIRRRV